MATNPTKSAGKVLQVLDVLWRNFASGFTNTELSKATGFSASDMTRYVKTLEEAGYAERIPETDKIRISHRVARHAVAVLNSLESAKARSEESIKRITTLL